MIKVFFLIPLLLSCFALFSNVGIFRKIDIKAITVRLSMLALFVISLFYLDYSDERSFYTLYSVLFTGIIVGVYGGPSILSNRVLIIIFQAIILLGFYIPFERIEMGVGTLFIILAFTSTSILQVKYLVAFIAPFLFLSSMPFISHTALLLSGALFLANSKNLISETDFLRYGLMVLSYFVLINHSVLQNYFEYFVAVFALLFLVELFWNNEWEIKMLNLSIITLNISAFFFSKSVVLMLLVILFVNYGYKYRSQRTLESGVIYLMPFLFIILLGSDYNPLYLEHLAKTPLGLVSLLAMFVLILSSSLYKAYLFFHKNTAGENTIVSSSNAVLLLTYPVLTIFSSDNSRFSGLVALLSFFIILSFVLALKLSSVDILKRIIDIDFRVLNIKSRRDYSIAEKLDSILFIFFTPVEIIKGFIIALSKFVHHLMEVLFFDTISTNNFKYRHIGFSSVFLIFIIWVVLWSTF